MELLGVFAARKRLDERSLDLIGIHRSQKGLKGDVQIKDVTLSQVCMGIYHLHLGTPSFF
jgi:hypothetical protein